MKYQLMLTLLSLTSAATFFFAYKGNLVPVAKAQSPQGQTSCIGVYPQSNNFDPKTELATAIRANACLPGSVSITSDVVNVAVNDGSPDYSTSVGYTVCCVMSSGS